MLVHCTFVHKQTMMVFIYDMSVEDRYVEIKFVKQTFVQVCVFVCVCVCVVCVCVFILALITFMHFPYYILS